MRRKRTVLLTLLLVAGLVAACGLWLRAQRRQYALNRALIAALVEVDDKKALVLVNAGADPNTRYKPMPVPSLPELVKQLFHRAPSPINDSKTALSIACYEVLLHRSEDTQLVQGMLAHGAKVNVKDEDGAAPLIWAARFNLLKTARLRLEHGANVNAQDEQGETPLMYATMVPPYTDMVRLLLEHGANPNLAENSGNTPLMLAQQFNRPDIVALLKGYGAREPGKRP